MNTLEILKVFLYTMLVNNGTVIKIIFEVRSGLSRGFCCCTYIVIAIATAIKSS